ncbi:non-specific serine/threonine protein kinase [Trifolium repens]|nr:non-specific serine/threonine protein kinase [Trifolium repens]
MKILSHGYVLLSNLLLIISIATIINGDDETDYMFQLMKSLTPTPTGWSNNTHHCKWKGISCNSTTQAVTSIILPSSSLTGILPPYLNNTLTNLTHIVLHNNSLNGPLPYFTNLFLLQTVSLGNNKFSSVPDNCFLHIQHLRTLNLSNNLNLSGWEFPTDDLLYSEYLDTLDLEATNMISKLDPDILFLFENLHIFFISHNKIRGNLPQSLGQSRIRYLRLNNNRFDGPISFISSMSNLFQAWLHNNSFTGRIPNMSNCTNLFDLQLHSNGLTGLIPPSLLTLPSLSIISLGDNMLQGRIPVFHKGVKATLEPNSFCRSDGGPCDPQIMILLDIFEALRSPVFLRNPPVTGNDACALTPMLFYRAIDRVLGGRLMIKCQREKIVSFEIWDLVLRGTISPAFSKLKSLVNLTLADNYLNGSIPDSLKTLPQLQLLDVSNNNLTGVIPKFSPKVKLNVTGNAFLAPNMSRQSDAQARGSSKANPRPVIWIAGQGGYGVVYKASLPDGRQVADLEQGNNPDNCIANSDEENDMVRQITMVSLWCIQMNPSDRPSMSKVLEMLQGPLQSVSYPPKPFLHSPEVSSLQTSYVSSINLLNTN